MDTIYFISDLHLTAKQPKVWKLFQHFLEKDAPKAHALYILGDFFESWIGDDGQDSFVEAVVNALRKLKESGTHIYLMTGNRDFLMTAEFAKQAGCIWLEDPWHGKIHNTPVTLTHGDALCTHDRKHMYFRKLSRHPFVKQLFLALPLSGRRYVASLIQRQSARHLSPALKRQLDPHPKAVRDLLRRYPSRYLIHGHTHHAHQETLKLKNGVTQRIVLGAWEDNGATILTWNSKDNPIFLKLSDRV